MSVKMSGMVWDANLPRPEKFVLLAYADHADHDGKNIFPAIDTIARKTGYKRRAVQAITKALSEPRPAIERDGKIEYPARDALLLDDGIGANGTNRWCMNVRGVQFLHPQDEWGAKTARGGAKNNPEGVQKTAKSMSKNAPEPSLKPSLEPPVKRERGSGETSFSSEPAPDFSNPDQFKKNINLPELKIYRQVTGRIPGMPQMPIIFEIIQEHGFSAEYLAPFWREWVKRGYQIKNLAWLDEWATAGEIPRPNGRAPTDEKPVPPDYQAQAEEKARKARERYLRAKAKQQAENPGSPKARTA